MYRIFSINARGRLCVYAGHGIDENWVFFIIDRLSFLSLILWVH